MSRELLRKSVHISMVGFALLIGRLPPWAICLLALTAFVHNLFVLPRLTGHALERRQERRDGYSLGMLAYPAVLFLLSLIFYEHQIYLAVAWGVMAFGDGFAGLLGPLIPGPKISWNREKSLLGTACFVLFGTTLTFGLIRLLPPETMLGGSSLHWLLAIAMATLAAALIETVPGLIDDNLTVPLVAGAVCFAVTQIAAVPDLPSGWPLATVLVLLLMVTTVASGKIDLPGGVTGGFLAFSIFLGCGFAGLALLFTFFFAGTLASKWRWREKVAAGLAQEAKGKRSTRHALANGGVAAVCGLLAWFFADHAPIFAAMAAGALASATADTLSSELGNVYGRRPVSILTLKPEPRGRDGVVTLEGTLLGACGALLLAVITLAFGATAWMAGAVLLAGVLGNLADSLLGATLQRSGRMNNDTVNAANTLAASLVVWILLGVVP